MLTWAESRQRKGRQIQGQAGSLLKLTFTNICICSKKEKLLYPQETAHVLYFVLYTWRQLEGQKSCRTFQSHPTGIDLEVLRPIFIHGIDEWR